MQINGELTQVICQPRNDKTDDDNGNYNDDDDDLVQELRDIAFKFSSAMTGVTESPARCPHHRQASPSSS